MAAGDLTTVQKVRDYLGISGLESDEILAQFVTSSSAWVTRQIGKSFSSGSVTETLDGDGTTRMLLRTRPVTAVTSVTVDGSTVPKRTTVGDSGWVFSHEGIDLVGYVFTRGIQNVVVVYTAGETVPADIEQATIEHVAFKFRRRNTLGKGSETLDGQSATYSDAGVLAGIEDLLAPYRVLVIT